MTKMCFAKRSLASSLRNYKGSVTLFVSLCLSSFILFISTLIFLCIYNAEKLRAYGYFDISANSVLGEYSISLYEIYDLLYIDSSFLTSSPQVNNVNNHFRNYLDINLNSYISQGSPWGELRLNESSITDFQTATAGYGDSMRSQAIRYCREANLKEKHQEEINPIYEAGDLSILTEESTVLEEWSAIMDHISGMKLPKKMNEKTKKMEEVQLANPADWAYGLSGSDILFLSEVSLDGISKHTIPIYDLCSNNITNVVTMTEFDTGSGDEFLLYLIEKMGCFGKQKEDRTLTCELEYIVAGEDSDFKNFQEVVQRIYDARLIDNLRIAKSDAGLRAECRSVAAMLEVCMLAPEFIEPVADSLLYACVFLESVSDVGGLLKGGKVMLHKTSHNMSATNLLSGGRYCIVGNEGLDYRQHVLAMILLMEEKKVNLRTMDLMELVVRRQTGNGFFSMDWCVERIKLLAVFSGNRAGNISFNQIYGIY